MKKTHYIFILLVTLTFIFSACKDEVIVVPPPPPPPPAETLDAYTWQKIYVGGDLWDMYAADTNDIYINVSGVPIYYNGKTFSTVNLQGPPIQVTEIDGYDAQNIFFGGGTLGGTYSDPVLKKMTNGVVTTYTIVGDSGREINDIYPISSNSAWLSTWAKNKIYFYDGGNLTTYILDSIVFAGRFYKDCFGNFYLFALRSINFIDQMYSYIFVNNRFELITIDTVESPSEKSECLHPCGKDILMCKPSPPVFWFNGMEWTKIFTISGFYIFNIGGRSKDTLIAFTFHESPDRGYTVRIWDGYQWKTEKNFPVFNLPYNADWGNAPVYLIDDKVIFTVSFNDGTESYLIIGRKNKKSQLKSNMPKLNIQSL